MKCSLAESQLRCVWRSLGQETSDNSYFCFPREVKALSESGYTVGSEICPVKASRDC